MAWALLRDSSRLREERSGGKTIDAVRPGLLPASKALGCVISLLDLSIARGTIIPRWDRLTFYSRNITFSGENFPV